MASEAPKYYPNFCSICGDHLNNLSPTTYANAVCGDYDSRVVSEPRLPALQGDNPVFIDGIRCFRRYKMGGWLSQRDAIGTQADSVIETHDRSRAVLRFYPTLMRSVQDIISN